MPELFSPVLAKPERRLKAMNIQLKITTKINLNLDVHKVLLVLLWPFFG